MSEPADPSAAAVLVFTSGSTARSRGVALSHHSLRANLLALSAARQAVPDETLLSTLPPSHAYELVAGQLAPLAAGARIVYAGAPLPNRLVETIRTQGVTRAALVPALFEALAREVIDGLAVADVAEPDCRRQPARELAARLRAWPSPARAHLRATIRDRIGATLQTVVIGGAAMNPAWAEILACVGLELDVGYGLTPIVRISGLSRVDRIPLIGRGSRSRAADPDRLTGHTRVH
jgi:long-chain acyl-CoA synthetase